MQCQNKVWWRFIRRAWGRLNPPPRSLQGRIPLVQLPHDMQSAARRLEDPRAASSIAYKSRVQEFERFDGVHPFIVDFYSAFIAELQARKMPFRAFQFVRSWEEQDRLKAQGRSKASGGHSPHQNGSAVDIIHFSRAWDLSRREWAVIGAIGKEVARKRNLPIEWGGDWDFYDPAHWQVADWRDWRAFMKGQPWPQLSNQLERQKFLSRFKAWQKGKTL